MIATIERFVKFAVAHSVRLQAADRTEEQSWINHSLGVVVFAGGIGASIGWMIGRVAFGFRVGLAVGIACYLWREIAQWANRERRGAWYWDATMDVLFPVWVASPVLFGPGTFYVLAVVVAAMAWAFRPIE